MNELRNINSVHDLVGEGVDTVCFVADYVELRFAGSMLRFLLYPVTVSRRDQQVDFPGPGSRDALCSLIGSVVTRVHVDGAALMLEFGDDALLIARIDEADERGPESVQFVPWENGRPNVAAMETW